MKTTNPLTIEINAALESMGISLKYCKLRVESTVIPGTDITGLRYDNSLRCDVTLTATRNGKVTLLYEGEYRMGLAHITIHRGLAFAPCDSALRIVSRATSHHPLSHNEVALLNETVSRHRQRGPVLADVMHCVLLDGTAALDETFESWCRNFSCSTDSRHAYDTYTRNTQIGIRFRQVLTGDEMAKLAELFANY
jgi:hypothetical protein